MDFSSSEGSKKDRRPPARSRGPFDEADRPASCAGGGPGWAMSLKLGKLPEMAAKVNLTRNFQFNFFLVKWYRCCEKQYSNSSEDEPQNFAVRPGSHTSGVHPEGGKQRLAQLFVNLCSQLRHSQMPEGIENHVSVQGPCLRWNTGLSYKGRNRPCHMPHPRGTFEALHA